MCDGYPDITIQFDKFNNGIFEFDTTTILQSSTKLLIPIRITSKKFKQLSRKPKFTTPKYTENTDKYTITFKDYLYKYSFVNKPCHNSIAHYSAADDEIIATCGISINDYSIFDIRTEQTNKTLTIIIQTMEKQSTENSASQNLSQTSRAAALVKQSSNIIPESKRFITKQQLFDYFSTKYPNEQLRGISVYYTYFERRTFGEQTKTYIIPESILFECLDTDDPSRTKGISEYLDDIKQSYPNCNYIVTYAGYKPKPNIHHVRSLLILPTKTTAASGYPYIPEQELSTNDEFEFLYPDLSDMDMQYLIHEYIPELHK